MSRCWRPACATRPSSWPAPASWSCPSSGRRSCGRPSSASDAGKSRPRKKVLEPVGMKQEVTGSLTRLRENVRLVYRGDPRAVDLVVTALLSRGHILIEDVPGVGKTTLARALGRSLSLEFRRIQFTSDTLPADVLGISVFHTPTERFEFHAGPIFSNIVLADEINRATPKTQSALLEAMNEGAVTIESERRLLPQPFMVVATQNPVEYLGTYPLPESQMDRFFLRLSLGYPGEEEEKMLLRRGGTEKALSAIASVLSPEEVLA